MRKCEICGIAELRNCGIAEFEELRNAEMRNCEI